MGARTGFRFSRGIIVCAIFLWVWLSPPTAAEPAPAASSDRAIAGLDSLSSATLLRALNYLEIRPAELGFEKMYADDDTFRLNIVEELLRDPLRIPAWQQSVVHDLHTAGDDPAALGNFLGRLVEADPATPVPKTRTAPGSLESFLARCATAAEALDAAFSRLTPADRESLLVLAPALWGNLEDDPLDKLTAGALHFEFGASADTSMDVGEDFILDQAVKLDRAALSRAACIFLGAWRDFAPAAAAEGEDAIDMTGVQGGVRRIETTPWGLLVVGGGGDNVYSAEALMKIAFLIEPGGDDVYRGRAASAVGDLLRPLSAIYDASGDDFYDAGARAYALGGAVLGVAALVDASGDDMYRGGDGVQGAGCFGAGFLLDGAGADTFVGRNLCQGAGAFGLGALVSSAAETPPPGPEFQPDRAFDAGFVRVPGTGAVAIRYDDNDIYTCARMSQGFASTFGAGLLFDRAGNDTYRSGGHYLHAPLLPHDFQSLSQGYSIGYRPRAAGGVGLLIDDAGNDFYSAEVYAQGVSYWYSIGLLYDGAGNDRYLATQYAQGAGVHLAIGSLWDRGGDDHYVAKLGVTQGTAHDLSAGWLIDESGNDYYVVSDGQGMSITNSTSIFIDGQGDDVYATPGVGQGWVTWARGFCGSGIFLDLEGRDTYPRKSPGENGAVWSPDMHAIGVDLDRDIQLPDEVLPEPVLTAADSARSVEDLFADASLWEVGSAREKVRRALKALTTKGLEAVDYVTANKLATKDGLEYRALKSVGDASPDTFAALILPRLRDPDEQVQRNVISLLGDLKRKEACEPLARLLEDAHQSKLWSRVIQALGSIGDPAARPAVRPFLVDREERRRLAAVGAIAALRDTSAIPAVAALLSDSLLTVRAAAYAALVPFGAAAVQPVVDRLSNDRCPRRVAHVRALAKLAGSLADSTGAHSLGARYVARRALLGELERRSAADAAARAAAVEGLIALGDEATLAAVRMCMADEPDELVQQTFSEAEKRRETEE